VSLYEWMLFLHMLSAFALVAALVVFWTLGVIARNVDRPVESLRYFRVARPANVLVAAGTVGVLVFGIVLAVERDEYSLLDGWILAAFVLWALAAETGRRGGAAYGQAEKLARELDAGGRGLESSPELRAKLQDRTAMLLNAVSSLLVLLLLVDMIWKPGA
jgi:hypothetical protein